MTGEHGQLDARCLVLESRSSAFWGSDATTTPAWCSLLQRGSSSAPRPASAALRAALRKASNQRWCTDSPTRCTPWASIIEPLASQTCVQAWVRAAHWRGLLGLGRNRRRAGFDRSMDAAQFLQGEAPAISTSPSVTVSAAIVASSK